MRLFVFGVRGSTPAPGRDFVRYGGHTSCVAFAHDGADRPSLVLDAGTGIRELSKTLLHQPFHGTILLGHLHWDHTQGLPFFPSGDREGSKVTLYVPCQFDEPPVELLARAMSVPHFPIRPDELDGDWSFLPLEPGVHELEGFTVEAREIPHKGGRTFGFRVSNGNAVVAYLSDHSPIAEGEGPDGEGELHDAALALCRDADIVLHDAQHLSAEFPARAHYGHSTVRYAVALAAKAGAKRLLLYHHDPGRTDGAIDAIVEEQRAAPLPVEAAAQGMVFEL